MISSPYSPVSIKPILIYFKYSKSPPYATYMEGSCKILFKFMTYVNCYAIKLLRYAIIYLVVVILTVFDTVCGHVLNFILESYEQR